MTPGEGLAGSWHSHARHARRLQRQISSISCASSNECHSSRHERRHQGRCDPHPHLLLYLHGCSNAFSVAEDLVETLRPQDVPQGGLGQQSAGRDHMPVTLLLCATRCFTWWSDARSPRWRLTPWRWTLCSRRRRPQRRSPSLASGPTRRGRWSIKVPLCVGLRVSLLGEVLRV